MPIASEVAARAHFITVDLHDSACETLLFCTESERGVEASEYNLADQIALVCAGNNYPSISATRRKQVSELSSFLDGNVFLE
jgi:hypothetical protein